MPDELPVVAWSAGAMALTSNGRPVPRLRAARVARGRGVRPRPGPGPGGHRPAPRPPTTPARGPGALVRPRAALPRPPAPAPRRRHLRGLHHRGSARGCGRGRCAPRHTGPSRTGCGCCGRTASSSRWGRRERAADGPQPAARAAPGRRGGDRPLPRAARMRRSWRGSGPPSSSAGRPTRSRVRHRVVGLPDPLPMRRLDGHRPVGGQTVLPEGSRVEYQLETAQRRAHHERFNDPLNPRVAHSPDGVELGVCGDRLRVPEWVHHDPEARPGRARRAGPAQQGAAARAARPALPAGALQPGHALPAADRARRRPTTSNFAAMQTVLDNLIHRLDIAPIVVAFVPPRDRLRSTRTTRRTPGSSPVSSCRTSPASCRCSTTPDGRCLMGSSFGGIASLSTAVRYPGRLRVPAPAVGVAGLHRHRHGARRRPGLRPGGEVRQPLPGPADRARWSGSS